MRQMILKCGSSSTSVRQLLRKGCGSDMHTVCSTAVIQGAQRPVRCLLVRYASAVMPSPFETPPAPAAPTAAAGAAPEAGRTDRFLFLGMLCVVSGQSGRRSGPRTCESRPSQLSLRGKVLVFSSFDVEVDLLTSTRASHSSRRGTRSTSPPTANELQATGSTAEVDACLVTHSSNNVTIRFGVISLFFGSSVLFLDKMLHDETCSFLLPGLVTPLLSLSYFSAGCFCGVSGLYAFPGLVQPQANVRASCSGNRCRRPDAGSFPGAQGAGCLFCRCLQSARERASFFVVVFIISRGVVFRVHDTQVREQCLSASESRGDQCWERQAVGEDSSSTNNNTAVVPATAIVFKSAEQALRPAGGLPSVNPAPIAVAPQAR